ncbi:MAG TPA: hypothetical protein VFT08_07985 [Pyrinomonadaceae bacterium]|nr:hypothetical protein [Pyrinomonadaceae bacterium]
MKFILIIAALTVCFVPGISLSNMAQLQAGSLCEQTEKIVFSCPIVNTKKTVSLCSSKELTKEKGYLQYRYGVPGKIELEFPSKREQTQSAFKYSHYFRAQFDMTDISFVNGDTEYSVFDDYNGEQKPVRHEQGVKITTPKREWVLSCRGQAKAHYEDLAEVLPEPE